MTQGLGSSNTFRLYVHGNGGHYVGLCTELRAVIEGSSADEIIVKAEALIDSVATRVKTRRPHITVRVSPSLREAPRA